MRFELQLGDNRNGGDAGGKEKPDLTDCRRPHILAVRLLLMMLSHNTYRYPVGVSPLSPKRGPGPVGRNVQKKPNLKKSHTPESCQAAPLRGPPLSPFDSPTVLPLGPTGIGSPFMNP